MVSRYNCSKYNKMKCFIALLTLMAVAGTVLASCSNKDVSGNDCAKLYDDDGCGGWGLGISTGFTELDFWKRNDAESVVVKAGCKFIGYDHDDRKGDKIEVDNTYGQYRLARDFDGSRELEEKISAVECTCSSAKPNFNDRSSRPNHQQMGGQGSSSSSGNSVVGRTGNSGPECNRVQFDRGAACILYDDSDCKSDKWSLPLTLFSGDTRSLTTYNQRNTVESVSVKAGCTLEVYKDANHRGDKYTIKAPYSQDRHDTLDKDRASNSFDDNIESVKCFC
jgi:hypothetical protein